MTNNKNSQKFVDIIEQQNQQAFQYNLIQSGTRNQEYNDQYLQDKKFIQQYKLLIDALGQLAGASNDQATLLPNVNNNNAVQSYIFEFKEQFEQVTFQNLQNKSLLSNEQLLGKVFQDLFVQLQYLHSLGLLVGHFDFNLLRYSQKTEQFFLAAFPTLMLADDAILRGVFGIQGDSSFQRQYLKISYVNKQIDYLHLIKQFLKELDRVGLLKNNQQKLKVKQKYDENEFNLIISQIDKTNYLEQYGIKVDQRVIEQLQPLLLQLQKELYKALQFLKLHKQQIKIDPEIAEQYKKDLTPILERIFSDDLNYKVDEIERLKIQVVNLLKQLAAEKKKIDINEPDYSDKNEIIESINQLIQLYK